MELKDLDIKGARSYTEFIRRIYTSSRNPVPESVVREVTIQITNQCNLRCSYCYEHNKCGGSMNFYTAKKCIDTLFDMYESDNDFINHNTKAIVLDFIGGEPLLEAKLIEKICDYYFHECYRRNIPLAPFTRISFATNGQLWFTPDAQHLFKKYHEFMSVCVSIDGVQELHDKYRINKYGEGSFEKAYKAFLDGRDKYGWYNSKMTFTPGSVGYLFDSVKMMIENGCTEVNCNFAYEPEYSIRDAMNIYYSLKKLADYLIDNNIHTFVSILDSALGGQVDLINDNKNYCGGTGNMLAFAADGKVYPCVRYMPVSIGKEKASRVCIGDCFSGVYQTDSEKKIKKSLDSITYTSQSPKKCIDCPISQGCGWCSGYNYELYGTANKRCTNICYAHKARILAICYYYNKRYLSLNDCSPKVIYMPYKEVVDIIGQSAANELFELQKQAAIKLQNEKGGV